MHTRKKTLIVASVATMAVMTGIVYYSTKGEPPKQPIAQQPASPDEVVTPLKAKNRQAMAGFMSKLARRVRQQAGQKALTEAGQRHQEMAQTLKTSFLKMHEIGRMINRDELRNEIMDNLLVEEGYAEMAADLVTDPEYAEWVFGDDQAMGRVFALKMIRRAGQLGNVKLVGDTVQRLGKRLNSPAKWEKGIQHDYVDLIASYVNLHDLDTFLENPKPILDQIGLTPKTSVEVLKGLYDSRLRGVPDEIQREKLGPYFAFNQ